MNIETIAPHDGHKDRMHREDRPRPTPIHWEDWIFAETAVVGDRRWVIQPADDGRSWFWGHEGLDALDETNVTVWDRTNHATRWAALMACEAAIRAYEVTA